MRHQHQTATKLAFRGRVLHEIVATPFWTCLSLRAKRTEVCPRAPSEHSSAIFQCYSWRSCIGTNPKMSCIVCNVS
jgi:hypothetical protein